MRCCDDLCHPARDSGEKSVITITNTQRSYRIDTDRIKKAATAMLTLLGYADFDLGILVCNTNRMAAFNKDYRGKEGPTDILSFPFYPELRPGEHITPASPDEANLGDIILCPEIINKKRLDWDRPFDDHCIVLLAHGIAHLLGHDHETDEDYARMQALEDKLLAAVKAR